MASLVTYALTNVADVKESLGIQSGDLSWDNLIIRKINQVTDQIENYCQRRFALTSYVEEYRASQIDEMTLKQRPIVVDGSHTFTAEWRTTALNVGDWETIDAQLYFIETTAGVLKLMFRAAGSWNRYRFTYSAGYATIPNDLAEAACQIACYYVTNATGNNVNVQLLKEGQREARYFEKTNFYGILQQLGVDEIIDAYANIPVLTDR